MVTGRDTAVAKTPGTSGSPQSSSRSRAHRVPRIRRMEPLNSLRPQGSKSDTRRVACSTQHSVQVAVDSVYETACTALSCSHHQPPAQAARPARACRCGIMETESRSRAERLQAASGGRVTSITTTSICERHVIERTDRAASSKHLSDAADHGSLGHIEPAFRKQPGPCCNLAQQTQGERVLVEAVESAIRELMKSVGGVDCRKLARKKPKGVFAGKRLVGPGIGSAMRARCCARPGATSSRREARSVERAGYRPAA